MTVKLKVMPDKRQKKLVNKTIKAYIAAYKHISAYIFATRDLNQVRIYERLFYGLYEMYGLCPSMVKCAIGTVMAKYKLVKEINAVWTHLSFSNAEFFLQWKKDYFITENKVAFRTLNGWINIPIGYNRAKKYLDSTWEIGSANLRRGTNKWILSISADKTKHTISAPARIVNNDKTA